MSKIVTAVNTMISNPEKITSVLAGEGNEFFFLYNRKYKWSIKNKDSEIYFLYYYADDTELNDLRNFDGSDWQQYSGMVSYSTKEIATKEASQSFRDLFLVVKEKAFGVDDVLNDIIKDDIEF